MNFPDNLYYTDHDEWVRNDDGVAVIGISDYAQDALGELVYIELPEVGAAFRSGEEVAEVESTKATSAIYAPVGGVIVEINESLDGSEEQVNEAPYGAGWLFKIKMSDAGELAALMRSDAYEKKIAD